MFYFKTLWTLFNINLHFKPNKYKKEEEKQLKNINFKNNFLKKTPVYHPYM